MNFELASFAVFVLILAALLYMDRKKIRLQGIMIIRKTERGKDFIDSVAKRYKRMWDALSVLGIGISIIALFAGSFFLMSNSLGILKGDIKEGVRLVLPWPSSQAEFQPGLLFLPWYLWIIAILSVVVPHEGFHGIMCRTEKIRIKTIGWFFLLFIPGAFVEPDDSQLKKSSRRAKLKVYSAGSFANFIMAFVFSLLGFVILSVFYSPGGIVPSSAVAGYPAAEANVSGAIVSVNGFPVRSHEDLSAILEKIQPGTLIALKTTADEYNITTVKHPELDKSFIGVSGPFSTYNEVSESYSSSSNILNFLRELFMWITILNFGIGLVNMLPIKPLDGGLVFEEIAGKFLKDSRFAVNFVSTTMILILLFNLVGPAIL